VATSPFTHSSTIPTATKYHGIFASVSWLTSA
jgi:hypothetical protein